jgi:hypothetical protein
MCSLDFALIYLHDHRTLVTSPVPFQDKRFTFTAQYELGQDTGIFGRANAAMQWGTTLSDDLTTEVDIDDAYAFEITGGYAWDIAERSYKIYARIARYTGDSPSVDEVETFLPLFQDTHGRYGYADFWHGQWGLGPFLGGDPGFKVLQLRFDAQVSSDLRLGGYAQETGSTERITLDEENKTLGREFGLAIGYDYGEHVMIEAAAALVNPTTALEATVSPVFEASTPRRFYIHTVARF